MPDSPLDQLTEVVGGYARIVAGIGDDQWALPTSCPEWTVRDLANHVHHGNLMFTRIMVGERPDLRRPLPETDLLGEKPEAVFRDAADAMLAAFGRPGALDMPVVVPAGPVPGIGALFLRVVELLVHGWDLATATGQRAEFDETIVAHAVAFTEVKLGDLPKGNTAFAPPVPVAADAPALQRLVALLGREPLRR